MTDTSLPNLRAFAVHIAEQLGELTDQPRQQIWRTLKVLGVEETQALVEQALQPETQQAHPRRDGLPRTPGGVFFMLVKQRVDRRDRWFIFAPKPAPAPPQTRQPASSRQPASAPTPTQETASPFQWTDRLAWLSEIGAERGGANTVKVTLVGRPGKVMERQGFVLASMPAMKLPPLPKGLSTPPADQTPLAVYIAAKQWRKVADALQQPEDVLIVEGVAVYDPELRGLAVFATNTTTKLLQSARRAGQNAPPAASE